MTRPDCRTSAYTLWLNGIGAVEVTVTDQGRGHPFLILHGAGGPRPVTAFADLLANTKAARVLVPTHPGFAGTTRPDGLNSVDGLAALYTGLLDELDVTGLTVIGLSFGGWIAAEMGLLGSTRISSLILVDAVGIEVTDHPVTDLSSLTMDQAIRLSYHDPDAFAVDPAALTAADQTMLASARAALMAYAGTSLTDPSLTERLSGITVPTLVLWGESDRIVDPDYGRAYAAAIPGARFGLLSAAGHAPQLETPDQLLRPVWDFATAHTSHQQNF